MKLPVSVVPSVSLAIRSRTTVLINGPTGSGKSILARWIHEQSERARAPFVTINLATVHEGTVESELFGHERGAFTGADQRRIGRLEAASGGTIFFDEIAELPLRLQARLLEFLQSKRVVRVGGNRELELDVRVIAATHRNLAQEVARGNFRADLFHRLRVLTIALPSLVERRDEFDSLVHVCLEEACRRAGRSVLRISEEVAHSLESHDWPGNLRELQNVLEYAALASNGPEILSSDLPSWFCEPVLEMNTTEAAGLYRLDYYSALDRFEREYLERALEASGGRINRTARKIAMNKTTLLRRLKKHSISPGFGAFSDGDRGEHTALMNVACQVI